MGAFLELVKQLQPVEKKRIMRPSDLAAEQQRMPKQDRELQWAFYNPPTDFNTLLQAYSTNAWVYSAVYLIASTASSVPFNLFTRQTRQPVDPRHFMYDVINQPNEWMTFTDLLESTFICLELVGNAFWEINYNNYGAPREVYFLNPSKMHIIPDAINYIRGYEYEVNGGIVRYEPHEIIHFKYANPQNEYWGIGSIQSIWDQVVLDGYAKDYNARFFLNDATPSGVISTPRPLSDTAFNTLQGRWERRHAGYKRSFKVAVLDDGMKFDPVATTPRDASFIEMKKIVRDALFVGTGVPPVLAGVPDVANYSTARVAQSIFYDSTIAPKLRKVGEAIDASLIKPQDAFIMGAFDTSVAPINIVKLSANSRIVERLVKAKLVTMDEARALLGLPPIQTAKLEKDPNIGSLDSGDAQSGEAESDDTEGSEGDSGDSGGGGGSGSGASDTGGGSSGTDFAGGTSPSSSSGGSSSSSSGGGSSNGGSTSTSIFKRKSTRTTRKR